MITTPDYNNCIVNLSNSILKYYGVKPYHPTLDAIDRVINKNYRNVVVIILDGLGMDALNHHLKPDDFLRKNLRTGISSVFPSSTTPGLISFETSQMPIEHGWLGESVFFRQEYKIVNCLDNTLKDSSEPAGFFYLADYYLPTEKIDEKLSKIGRVQVNRISPIGSNAFSKIDSIISRVKRVCSSKWKTFTFAYCDEPFVTMREKGVYHPDNTQLIKILNDKLEVMCNSLTDTLVCITATHGITDVDNIILSHDKEIADMLQFPISLESRAVSLYVKDEFKSVFREKFEKKYGDDFDLLSKEEVEKKTIFGPGKPNQNLTAIGDFIAIATGSKAFLWDDNSPAKICTSGGLSDKEISLPLIILEKKGKETLSFERRK
ncbi:MAG: alkaline phosphatase family protein [Treponema sp.]|nr:alkaline phosphatase family protein [Treponema sp.]